MRPVALFAAIGAVLVIIAALAGFAGLRLIRLSEPVVSDNQGTTIEVEQHKHPGPIR